ncbi:MAG: serine/threonine protein phosphatase [Ruminococcaceae bacterium]|nr:serine/threonine protein phosphatase [Oscillospiraceae bacterium]
MALYAIADLHLSLGTDKPMDIFKGWRDYKDRLENNWRALINEDDTVVIAGDISWAMKLEECYEDFSFINSLPGTKILLKGNHDYWWATKKKIDEYLEANNFDSIKILFNNSFTVEDFTICGSRGWYYDADTEADIKVINREVGRLKLSLDSAKESSKTPIVFLHYPPVYAQLECKEIMDTLIDYGIKECYYGHLHGSHTHKNAVIGNYKDVNMHLISCDFVDFMPVLVRN